MSSSAEGDLARRVWQAMSEVALRHDRKIAICQALGLSWTRVLVLRRLAAGLQTQRQLAEHLTADPPYVTLLVDDLEAHRLVRRRPHPTDRRAKLVELTRKGAATAQRAAEMLFEPPPALRDVPQKDLLVVARVLGHLSR